MKRMYLDESGNHDLLRIDEQYPIFVLGGVIVDAAYADTEMAERFAKLKADVFGSPEIILHTAEIARNRNAFECLKNAAKRQEFYRALNDVMRTLKYKVVACAINKRAHLDRYGGSAVDPYWLSLQVLVERFCYEIGTSSAGGEIIAECRRPDLDKQLHAAYRSIQTRYLDHATISARISGLTCVPKTANLAGLQIADLVVSPIGRHVLDKPAKEDFEIVRRKFRGGRDFAGKGLVVLPKN
jgi:hypothetical protein